MGKQGKILDVLKRIGQFILTICVIFYLSRLFNFVAAKLDDRFIFSKCLDCLPWFHFIFNYAFLFLCLIGFIRLIILVKRGIVSKFWIFDGLIGLIMVAFAIYPTVYFTHNLIKYPNALPIVLRVSPSDQTYVFYEGQIPPDKQKTLTGFVIQKDNPIPIRYENGKIQEYESKSNKCYISDDIEYSESKTKATHKKTHELITGFVLTSHQSTDILLEYLNGKFTGNRFVFTKRDDDTTRILDTWLYLKDKLSNFLKYEGFYPNGHLMHKNRVVKGKAIIDWYLPNGQLILKTVNQNLGADNPSASVVSLQQAYYNSKGELVAYWDMRRGTALCVSSDGKGRRMTPEEVDRFFKDGDKLAAGQIPEFHCE